MISFAQSTVQNGMGSEIRPVPMAHEAIVLKRAVNFSNVVTKGTVALDLHPTNNLTSCI
jgi:hypothetical protein